MNISITEDINGQKYVRVEPQESRVGHWIPIHVSNIWQSVFSCSECGKTVGIYISLGQRLYSLYNRCPSCHAKMESEET